MPVGRSKSGFRRVFNQHGIKTVKNTQRHLGDCVS